jgi:hypothetical protein
MAVGILSKNNFCKIFTKIINMSQQLIYRKEFGIGLVWSSAIRIICDRGIRTHGPRIQVHCPLLLSKTTICKNIFKIITNLPKISPKFTGIRTHGLRIQVQRVVHFFQGRCNRDKPACKYFHPPQHLKDQVRRFNKSSFRPKKTFRTNFRPQTFGKKFHPKTTNTYTYVRFV